MSSALMLTDTKISVGWGCIVATHARVQRQARLSFPPKSCKNDNAFLTFTGLEQPSMRTITQIRDPLFLVRRKFYQIHPSIFGLGK